jgi:exo-beta-1,3-glucanase (GH17 family)
MRPQTPEDASVAAPAELPARDGQPADRPRVGPPGAAAPVGAVRRATLLAVLATAALAAVLHWIQLGRPVQIAEPGSERIECVSYAPFHRPGDSPFDPTAIVDEARIEADLRAVSARSACVRTYSVSQGLDAVPRIASRLGMTVLLGAWIGRDRPENEIELALAIGLAREHAATVRALVVGNEVMLRRELPETELVAYIERARREVPVPVTYADVWEFWLEHRSIAPAVTFVTIHVLPYWEDEPVGIEAAIAHVRDVYRRMQAELPGREILIGETGWPSDGRARRDAVPGRVEQARFIRQFTRMAAQERIGYNLIEAFDQPWKRRLEGAMGGEWGLWDSDGRPKFEWHGPVAPRPDWRLGVWSALAGALAGGAMLAATAFAGRARPPPAARNLVLRAAIGVAVGAGLGAMLAEQVRYLTVWNRGPLEWAATSGATAVALLCCAASAMLLARRLVSPRPGGDLLPSSASVLRGWRRAGGPSLEGWAGLLHGAVLFAAAITVVLHGFDARYRGFDWPLFAPPAVAAALLWGAGMRRGDDALEERWLAAVLAIGAAVMVVKEGVSNPQALFYAALMVVLAACARARTSTSRPSSVPTAAGS